MKCPVCGEAMQYSEGEDEDLEGRLFAYAYYFCVGCDRIINDWEDEFEYPEDDK